MDMMTFSVQGCDGTFCQYPEEQRAFSLDDMVDVAFCKTCWGQEMNRRKRTGRGQVLPFPCKETASHVPDLKYLGFDNKNPSFQKIRRGPKLEE